ncbi:hypothetical protein, partial [Yersinia pseudotuberculosis]|uniref:hypothetical protein n=1 Tax=Yersinia pseudotuberculosis TaxID=633 RepID=UPI002000CB55
MGQPRASLRRPRVVLIAAIQRTDGPSVLNEPKAFAADSQALAHSEAETPRKGLGGPAAPHRGCRPPPAQSAREGEAAKPLRGSLISLLAQKRR